jgi:phosphoribosylformylglycinamidine synthase
MVTDTKHVRYFMGDVLEADIPAESLVLGGGAPVYRRTWTEPEYMKEIAKFDLNSVADLSLAEAKDAAIKLCNEPNIASKRWIYEQYDSMVGTINESTNLPSDAAVVKIVGSEKSLALTVDCNSRYVFADPNKGTQIAVAEAARNIRCTGGVPTAITNCLNFGNPYNEEVYYQFKNAIEGMSEACRKFDTPVTGGNVSFYNQSTNGQAVYPTPTIGMVGIIEQPEHRMSIPFGDAGDAIVLLGTTRNDLGSSQYIAKVKGVSHSPCPSFDLDEEYALHLLLETLSKEQAVASAHDISEGGLFVACMESAMAGGKGFDVCTEKGLRIDAGLFGESQSRVVVSVSQDGLGRLMKLASEAGVVATHVGTVLADKVICVNGEDWGAMETFATPYHQVIASYLN